jgi:hypothetical protein
MTQLYISFYNATGKFTGQSSCEESLMPMVKEETAKIPNLDPFIDGDWFGKPYYVLDGVATLQPENPAILSGLELTSLPVPSIININKVDYPCTDSVATLSFNQPGTYKVTVKSWPYLDKEFTIEN